MLLKFAFEEFLSEKEFENLSKNTIEGYKMLFSDFLSWAEENGIERVEDVSSRHLKAYLNMCKTEKGNNPTSINTKRKQFRAFFNFLVSEGILDENPTDNVKRVREDIRINTFSDEEVQQIITYLRRTKRREDTFYAVRNYTIFMTLIGTGMRVGELVSLKWHNVDFQHRTIKVFGKMRREEFIPLSERLCDELRYWEGYCTRHFGKTPQSVFMSLSGAPLTVNGVKCWFKRLAKKMNFPETRCSAHSCRHYFAKKWIQNGGDISTLARVLRHSSIKTTERYLQFWGNEVAEDNDRYNPLNNL